MSHAAQDSHGRRQGLQSLLHPATPYHQHACMNKAHFFISLLGEIAKPNNSLNTSRTLLGDMQPLMHGGKWCATKNTGIVAGIISRRSVCGFSRPVMRVHQFHQCPVQIITPLADNQTNATSSNIRQKFISTKAACILHTLQPCQQLGLIVRDQSAH